MGQSNLSDFSKKKEDKDLVHIGGGTYIRADFLKVNIEEGQYGKGGFRGR